MDEASKGWPRVESGERRVACELCDCLHEHQPLAERESARCRNCGATLYENRQLSLQRAISFASSAFFLMLIVLFFPFISIDAYGSKASMTVWTCLENLWANGSPVVAIAIGAVVVVFPLAIILLLLHVSVPLLFEHAGRGAEHSLRAILWLMHWSMIEVFFLGAVVSLVKLVSLADVVLGVGFWASAGVMVFLAAALGSVDKIEFWDRVESARLREGSSLK